MIDNNARYNRSSSYRTEFINKHPGFRGWYMCVYCGRVMRKKKMQVDHIIPVHLVRTSRFYRRLLGKDRGVNDDHNLVPACGRCNKRKGHKGGLWAIKGKTGKYWQFAAWFLFISILAIYGYWFFSEKLYTYIFNFITEVFVK